MNFYENLCRGLLEEKQYDLALEIANNYVIKSSALLKIYKFNS
jgi:hypothetical protein